MITKLKNKFSEIIKNQNRLRYVNDGSDFDTKKLFIRKKDIDGIANNLAIWFSEKYEELFYNEEYSMDDLSDFYEETYPSR